MTVDPRKDKLPPVFSRSFSVPLGSVQEKDTKKRAALSLNDMLLKPKAVDSGATEKGTINQENFSCSGVPSLAPNSNASKAGSAHEGDVLSISSTSSSLDKPPTGDPPSTCSVGRESSLAVVDLDEVPDSEVSKTGKVSDTLRMGNSLDAKPPDYEEPSTGKIDGDHTGNSNEYDVVQESKTDKTDDSVGDLSVVGKTPECCHSSNLDKFPESGGSPPPYDSEFDTTKPTSPNRELGLSDMGEFPVTLGHDSTEDPSMPVDKNRNDPVSSLGVSNSRRAKSLPDLGVEHLSGTNDVKRRVVSLSVGNSTPGISLIISNGDHDLDTDKTEHSVLTPGDVDIGPDTSNDNMGTTAGRSSKKENESDLAPFPVLETLSLVNNLVRQNQLCVWLT